MASIRGKLVIKFIYRFVNANPERKSDLVKLLKNFQGKPTKYKPPEGYTLEKFEAEGIPMEMFKKEGTTPKNAVFIIHGGAFIGELCDTYRKDYVKYSQAAGDAAVFNINYRTAPEYTFPAAHDDAIKGWRKILSMGFDPKNILLVGDSAGGNLVLSTTLKLRDSGEALPRAVVAMSPWADLAVTGQSYFDNYNKDPMFGNKKGKASPELIEKFINGSIFVYCGDADRKNPYLSPVFGEYHGFPPVHISVGSHELLYDESITIYNKINQSGGSATLHVGKEMFHVFPLLHPIIPESKLAWKDIIEFIEKQFS